MTDRRIRSTTLDFVAYVLFVAAVILLSIDWTWSAPYPAAGNIVVADRWTGAHRIILMPQGPAAMLPELEHRLNSEAFYGRIREVLSDHEPVRRWDESRVHLLPLLAGPDGPLVVRVEGMMYGRRSWSLWEQTWRPDRRRNAALLSDLEKFLKAELTPEGEAPSSWPGDGPGRGRDEPAGP